jgi:coenzyme F420 hydrogenase subunit beta
MKSLNDVVKANLCLGCGLCTLNNDIDNEKVELEYNDRRGAYTPKVIKNLNSLNAKKGFEACPGKGYEINSLAEEYDFESNFDKDLGYYDNLYAIQSDREEILKKASSSGVMTNILNYLLDEKYVERVIVTKFVYTDEGPRASPFLTNKFEDLLEAQGSKYCPVSFDEVLKDLKSTEVKTSSAFVGTPCQIAALKHIQSNEQDLGIKYFIGNFCGGFKSYNNIKKLITLNDIKPKDVKQFRFRGGGQPGSLRIESPTKVVEIPYPKYTGYTGYSKVKRCHLCVDATAELADIACGDAWLPEFLNSNSPTSVVITRNKKATSILNEMESKGLLNINPISAEKIIQSQKGNLNTKKYRQSSRMKLYTLLGITMPIINQGYKKERTYSLSFELKVLSSQKIRLFFENIGLYYSVYVKDNLLKRVYKKVISNKGN